MGSYLRNKVKLAVGAEWGQPSRTGVRATWWADTMRKAEEVPIIGQGRAIARALLNFMLPVSGAHLDAVHLKEGSPTLLARVICVIGEAVRGGAPHAAAAQCPRRRPPFVDTWQSRCCKLITTPLPPPRQPMLVRIVTEAVPDGTPVHKVNFKNMQYVDVLLLPGESLVMPGISAREYVHQVFQFKGSSSFRFITTYSKKTNQTKKKNA